MDPIIKVGEPHPLFPAPLQPGAFWRWWGPGVDLVIAGHNSPQHVVDAFCADELLFALADEPPAIWLLFAFGALIPWHTIPFNIHRLPQRRRPDPVFFTKPGEVFRGYVHVLEAGTAVVRGIRVLTLTPEFSRKLAELIEAQHAAGWKGMQEYERGLAEVRQRLPTAEAMLGRAVCGMRSVSKGRR